MTRFAWLQTRPQTLLVAGLLIALAITAAITGVDLSHLINHLTCRAGCDVPVNQFDRFLEHAFDLLMLLAPALIGIFWGAPLVAREFETGTHRLAWTQGVTRSRWLLTKLAIGAVVAVAIAGALTLTVTWWSRASDALGTNQYLVFDRRSIAPVGYALFAFALGALAGAVVRRTVPAMAATLGVFAFARIAVAAWIRPHLLGRLHQTMSLLNADGFGFESNNGSPVRLVAKGVAPQNSWTLSSQLVTGSGHVASTAQLTAFVHQHCPAIATPPATASVVHRAAPADVATFDACRAQAAHVFHLVVGYEPASRYWTFQWLETGIFAALALLAASGCYWWITRRSS